MPSYFYHLALELYPHPPNDPEAAISSTSQDSSIHIPPPHTDIFTSSLPTHRISSWSEVASKKKGHRRSNTITTSTRGAAHSEIQRPALGRTASISSGDFRRRPVPDNVVSPTNLTPRTTDAPKDWRFGRVSVQSINMEEKKEGADLGRPRGKSAGQNAHTGGMATRGKFVPSDPKNTELGWGVVHLYRDAKETPGLYDDSSSTTGSDSANGADTPAFNENECTTLCILAVPSYMTPSDFLGFVGEQTREEVSHFRLIRTARANKYMVLMKFREAKKAKAWQKEWNGKHFNSMEPENCHVVFVKSIEFPSPDAQGSPSSFPTMTNDPFTPSAYPNPSAPLAPGVGAIKALAPPTPALIELPTCPVCLERMDESTGLLTILCQHVFHCNCLEKWHGSGCPVCRYTQNDTLLGRLASGEDEEDVGCSVCGSAANLWVCLICGNVGCGRYDSAHAFAHYEATSHSYAMDIATQHVWDYAGDGYVHRLISTKGDGKMGDAAGAAGGMTAYNSDSVPREKLDNMGMEYAYLLTSQLDSQRTYFEEQLDRAVDKASIATAAAEKASRVAEDLSDQLERLHTNYSSAQVAIASLEKAVQRAERRAEKAEQLARKMTKDWQEEKSVGEGLVKRINFMEGKVKEADEKVSKLEGEKRDLEEQNRDLSFFISGSAKLKQLEEGGEEIEDGKVEVPVQEASKKRKGKGKK
ncbi:zf-UBP-domain-containing protein [Rhizodiscina lignyota]|uniref:Zf-UBP-domain-containing protein n=1 Tax=Rhizodiscina lignyota TaxID=1504668 RepID=A0A9P4IQD3_9PEZI|nr:zf-UBP-domain-containing protein [Rhizodiscina lignyota]